MTLCVLLCPALLSGCGSAPIVNEPGTQATLIFDADQYPDVHAATVDVLRDHGFEIQRNDYRFGVVTTKPKESPTAAEFWIDDATTTDQHLADTLNAQQRSVKVNIERRANQLEPSLIAYHLTVEVMIERLQQPTRYLTHSARSAITSQYTATSTHLTDRGIAGSYAQKLESDPHLAGRLARDIAEQAGLAGAADGG